MLILLIETSTERGLVAILDGLNILFHRSLPFGYQNSKMLLATIDEGLKAVGKQLTEFTFIGVGVGPGSYTGIRVGAIVAKSLSYAAAVPLVGVCSLETFMPLQNGLFATMIDAKIGGIYLIKGKKDSDQITYLSEPQILSITDAMPILEDVKQIITPNALRLKALWKEIHWAWQELSPDPIHFAKRAILKFEKGQFSRDSSLELLYLRKTQAELELEREHGCKPDYPKN